MHPNVTEQESARLQAVRRLDLLDTPPEAAFDDLATLAAHICETPIALISVLDERRQWFKARVGLEVAETDRDVAFCARTIEQPDLFIVPDALRDNRFAGNPLVTSAPHIRFYAGAPLHTTDGYALGSLCVIDRQPRQLSRSQEEALRILARQVEGQLALRRHEQERQRTEEIVRRQRQAMDAATDGIAVLNAAGEYLYLNRAHATLFGYATPEELVGKTWRVLYDASKIEHIEREIFPQLQAAGRWQGEATARRKDGSHFDEGLSLTLVEGVGLICVCRDISAQKWAEAEVRRLNADLEKRVAERTSALAASNRELAQSRERFAAAVRGSSDGIWDWNIVTGEGYFSERYCELLGYAPGEPVAHVDTWVSLIHPDDRARVQEQVRVHLEQRVPFDAEYRLRTKGGDYRWFRSRGQAIWDASGRPVRMAGSISDITERRRIEMERDRFFAQSPDLLAIAGFDGFLKRINPVWTQLLGYSEAELLAMPYFDLVLPEDRVRVEDVLRVLSHDQPVTDFEVRMRCRDGSWRWTQWKSTAVADDGIIYAVGRDITGRKEAEEQVRAYQDQLRAMSAELLQTEEAERRRIASDLHDQVGQTLAACRLKLNECAAAVQDPALKAGAQAVRALLDQAIQETRTLSFDLSPPVLHELGLVPALEWLAESHNNRPEGVRVHCEATGPVPATGELSVLLFRIVRELLVNVAKHARAREARICLRGEAPVIRIEVSDDGAGFDPEPALAPQGHSQGFGLFSIRDRLRFIGGRLEVHSAPGQGTQVIVTAPLPQPPTAKD